MLHGYTSDISSYMLTVSWLGYAIGCPLLGYVSDLISRRKIIMICSSLLCIISVLIIIYISVNIVFTMFGFLLLGLGASGQSIGFAIIAEQCSSSYLAAGLGLNNAAIMLVTSTIAPLIGWILSLLSKGNSISITNYQTAFTLIPLIMFIALIFAIFFIKETFCKSSKETTILKY